MVRHTDADFDPEPLTTDELAAYINEVAPIAANLPDGEYAEPVLTANAEVAIAEFRDRHGITVDGDDHLTGDDRDPSDAERAFGDTVDAFEDAVADAVATDGGKSRVDAAIDAEVGEGVDHYLRHVEPEEYDIKIRHAGSIRTEVVDDVVVHKVVESVDPDAHGDSVSFSKGSYTCPVHDREHAESDRTVDEDDEQIRVDYTCTGDDGACPFEATAVMRRGEFDTPDYKRPEFIRLTIPHVFDDDTFDADRFESLVDAADHGDEDDRTAVANMIRRLAVDDIKVIYDSAYVKAEWEHDDDGTPTEKTADAYIDSYECDRCGDEHDAGTERSHPHFGTVCPACEDATVWSPDDADLPDDVVDRMNDHKTFSVGNIVGLLRDVKHYPNYVARLSNDSDGGMFGVDEDDVDPDDVGPIHTGKQGRRSMGRGDWERGTGLRRSTDGVFNGMSNWRTLLSDAVDTGLITRADDADDVADEDTNARWVTTDKGDAVWSELARCKTCGGERKPYANKSHYQAGRRSESSVSLVTKCPSCDAKSFGGKGDSTTSQAVRLPGVTYGDE